MMKPVIPCKECVYGTRYYGGVIHCPHPEMISVRDENNMRLMNISDIKDTVLVMEDGDGCTRGKRKDKQVDE